MSAFFRRLGYLRYLIKPQLWPELIRRLRNKLESKKDDETRDASLHEEAVAWCRSRARSTKEAFTQITGRPELLVPIREKYAQEFSQAEQAAAACPVKMGGAGNLDLLYALCEYTQAQTVLETGVAYGWSSLALLLSLRNRASSRLYSVDLPYLELHNDRWVGIVVPESLRGQWTLYRMADREGAPRAIQAAGLFDLVHYDSDKSYSGRLATYHLIWSALRTGGILVSDDIGDNPAFRDFCQEIGIEPAVIEYERKYQGIAVKPERSQDR